MILGIIKKEATLKFIIAICVLTCLLGCNLSSSPIPKTDMATSTPSLNQGFIGHVYAAYGGPAVLCGTETCTPAPPMLSPMQNVHVVVVDPDMKEILTETVSLEDGSYKVKVAPGKYRVCLKWDTGMTCNNVDTVHANTYIVEDFQVGQG